MVFGPFFLPLDFWRVGYFVTSRDHPIATAELAWCMQVSAATISGATCRRHSHWLFLLAVLFSAAANAAMMRQSTAFLLQASAKLQLAAQLRTAAHGRAGALSVLGRRRFGVFKPFSDELEDRSNAKLKAAPEPELVLDWLKNTQVRFCVCVCVLKCELV